MQLRQSMIVLNAQRTVVFILKLIHPPCIPVRYSKSSSLSFGQHLSLKSTVVTLLADPNTEHLSDRGWLDFWEFLVQGFIFREIEQTFRDIQSKFAEILLKKLLREERVHRRVRGQLGDLASFKLLDTVISHSEL